MIVTHGANLVHPAARISLALAAYEASGKHPSFVTSLGHSKSTLLSDIISEAVDTIEGVYAAAGLEVPSLDDSFDPKAPAEVLRQDSVVSSATMNLVAAAGQIAAAVQDPVLSALNNAHAAPGTLPLPVRQR
ncbi:hypothetical protein C8R44DRAFT_890040 [Mycena epipterygia]|nr:hypothetical protein C8R44DRAFT_890040 [Mycena epipterygia]